MLIVLSPLVVVAALAMRVLPDAVDRGRGSELAGSSRLAGAVLAARCGQARASAALAAQLAAATPAAALAPRLEDLVKRQLADGFAVVGADGRAVASAGPIPSVLPEQDCTQGVIVRDAAGGAWIAATAQLQRAVAGGQAVPAGGVVAAFAVDGTLAGRISESLGGRPVVLLVDGEQAASSASVPDAVVAASVADRGGTVKVGGTLAAVAGARDGQPVSVLVTAPAARRRALLVPLLAVGGLFVLLATAVALLLARATARPLEELNEAAARLAGGDLTTDIAVRDRDEVGRLAGNFNALTHELRGYAGALQQSRDEVQATLARLGDALSGTHDLGRLLAVVLETSLASTGARSGAVLMRSGDRLELASGQGLAGTAMAAGLSLRGDQGIAGEVARSGVAVRGLADRLGPADGEPVGVDLMAVPLARSGQVAGVLMVFDRDEPFAESDLLMLRSFAGQATIAIDNVLLHEETRRQSLTDGLTGLWNYRYFQLTVGKEIERASRFSRPMSLLMLDLDRFKRVNDTHGHQRGDAVLVELADRLRAQVRDVDLVARYGGEEFVIVLPETDEAGAVMAAERIRAAVRGTRFGDDGQPLELTISIGIAVFPSHGGTSAALLRRADDALYMAKREGRDTFRLAAAPLPD